MRREIERRHRWIAAGIGLFAPCGWAAAQSSSLFLQEQDQRMRQAAATTRPTDHGGMRQDAGATSPPPAPRNNALAVLSLTAIRPPEPKQIQVNDFIGVIVRHRLRYQSDARLQQQSRWDLKSKLNAWFRLHDNHKWVQQDFEGGTPNIDFKNENNLQNQGRLNRNDIFETRVKAKVVDVKPNGTLVIFAISRVKIDEEDQWISLTGEVHKDDIGPDGNVTSDKVFALDVKTENDGAMKDLAKRGWLKGFLDKYKAF